MKMTPTPSQNRLQELLDYDPNTGKLYWKERSLSSFKTPSAGLTWNKRFAGKEAFTAQDAKGYYRGAIDYTNYLAHRIIFKYINGYDPNQVEHDDRDPSNNKADNLFDLDATGNSRNSKLYNNNTSGYAGVCWDGSRSKWIAAITVNYKNIHLGRFTNQADAIQARKDAEKQYGFHVNHGK